jgi:energy-coupling factor transporter ATP-binding protein EcfA2
MLKLSSLRKAYRTESVETTALDNIDLQIDAGEFVAIMGPSGCGKSTLLNIIGLLDRPTAGNYSLEGREPAIAAAAAIAGLTRCVRPPGALTPFEIAVRGRRAALARLQPVGVHRQTHRATRLTPLEAGGDENLVQALGLGLALDQAGARHHQRQLDVGGTWRPLSHGSRLTQILDARVGARADEDLVDGDLVDRRVRVEAHVLQRALHAFALDRIGFSWPGRARAVDGETISGEVPQVTCGLMSSAFSVDDAVELRAGIGMQGAPVGDGLIPGRPWARRDGP